MTPNSTSWFVPILEYEGDSVEPLRALSDRVEPSPNRLKTLVELAETGEPHTETASLWLLKHWVEAGAKVDAPLVERLIALLIREEAALPSDATLQLLQLLPSLPEPLPEPARLFTTLKTLAGDRHTFLRAWALNSLALIAHRHPAFQDEAELWLLRAESTDSASVRARIRKARAGKFRA